jgi:hypothetical protein
MRGHGFFQNDLHDRLRVTLHLHRRNDYALPNLPRFVGQKLLTTRSWEQLRLLKVTWTANPMNQT